MSGLYLGLGSVRKKDNSSLRAGMFHDLIQSRLIYKIVYKWAQAPVIGVPASLAFTFYALCRIFHVHIQLNRRPGLIAVYQYDNETRCIKARSKRPIEEFVTFKKSFLEAKPLLAVISYCLKSLSSVPKTMRVSQKLIKKYGILIGTRQTQVICVYAFFKDYFSCLDMSESRIVISTESNPDVIAVALAGRLYQSKVIYVNHSFLDSHLGLFFHDELVVQGKALLSIIENNLTAKKVPVVKMIGPYFDTEPLRLPLSHVKTVGIVCSLGPNVAQIELLISQLTKKYHNVEIEVRLHPNKLLSGYLIERLETYSAVKIVPSMDWAKADYRHWDFAVAANTSAHIDLIGKGIPTVGYDFDNHPDDMYDFYTKGFVPKVQDVMKVEETINLFYSNVDWKNICFSYLPESEKSLEL
ncbi:hypothetical protein SHI21_10765 [Bacteriovorax sp. PP10]|uniref:Uncharacterized protein n=1 Tax=Bacteriovorax antarcticus TaxID=3088717 RepID=A0ABU5VXE5_9BACT|nr:hypothetical protein [Bacteriovorax sp. PP10]MEA9356690.1 hypothetical protein [Bacteriovorax sp. PP10]